MRYWEATNAVSAPKPRRTAVSDAWLIAKAVAMMLALMGLLWLVLVAGGTE